MVHLLDCPGFPCDDVDHRRFALPPFPADPVRLVVVAEAPAADIRDSFWSPEEPFYWQTARRAFVEAGLELDDPGDLAGHGIYLTTAIKCSKLGYGVSAATIAACAERILEQELAALAGAVAIALMGDVAIKALNALARRRGEKRVVPAGPTWKIRGTYDWNGITVIPSYLFTGRSYLIEASKREMIAEDLGVALATAGIT
jgi:uracil-DNA glycosylase